MIESATTAQFAMDNQFDLAKPPGRPNLSSTEGDFKVTLYWDDSSEESYDKFSGYDFEGYRLYKSSNKGLTWKRLIDYDLNNSAGNNTGLQYSFVDTNVVNGFEYWYSITAYDKGSEDFESLESAIGNTLDAVNTISVIPRSEAIGRTSVTPIEVINLNTGKTNYVLNASTIDNELLAGNEYKTVISVTTLKRNLVNL